MKTVDGYITVGRDVKGNRLVIDVGSKFGSACTTLTPSEWVEMKKTGDTEYKAILAQRAGRRK